MALSSIMTQSLLSANTSRQIAHVQHAAKKEMDGHAGVLDAEIKLDSARGGDVKKKQEELEETKKKASALEETTVNTLNAANEDLKKAAKEDQEVQRAEKAAEKKKAEKAAEKKKAEKKAEEERIEKAGDVSISETTEPEDGIQAVPVDSTVSNATTIDVVIDTMTPGIGNVITTGKEVDVKV